jgi:hypothetical protein
MASGQVVEYCGGRIGSAGSISHKQCSAGLRLAFANLRPGLAEFVEQRFLDDLMNEQNRIDTHGLGQPAKRFRQVANRYRPYHHRLRYREYRTRG